MATEVYPKTALASYKRISKGSCFVLMPFAREFDRVYRRITETLEAPGLEMAVSRADDFYDANILGGILKSIARSEYIITDLTGLNANVCYETGIAHCVKDADNVIILTQDIATVPFDLRHLRCIIYDPTPSGMKRLKAALEETFKHLYRDRYNIVLREGARFTFDKTLVGRDRNFFELTFSCPYIACNAAKIWISFSEKSVYSISATAEDQLIVLSYDQTHAELEYIPWDVHLLRFEENKAHIVLEQRRS